MLKPSSSGAFELSAQDKVIWLEPAAVTVKLPASAGGASLVVALAVLELALPAALNAETLK